MGVEMTYCEEDTIAAVSSPAGSAARGIVRLSGGEAIRIARKITSPAEPLGSDRNYFHFGGSISADKTVGEVPARVYVMRAPTSYTREDIVEFHTFGSAPILHGVLQRMLGEGARMAEPGEFTRRAFLNGRIDLTQAEGVLSLITSRSDAQRRAALAQLSGQLFNSFESIREGLVSLLARVEANLDFSDQEIEVISREELRSELERLIGEISDVLSSVGSRTVFKEEVLAAIVGRPNVGKSSLFNALLRRERAIISREAGTTRDTLEEVMEFEGITVRLVDTAGVVGGAEGVSAEAANRSLAAMEAAELVVFVVDVSEELTEEDRDVASRIAAPGILVLNKSDLERRVEEKDAEELVPSAPVVFTSALQGWGLDEVLEETASAVRSGKVVRAASRFALTAEQHGVLRNVLSQLHEAASASEGGLSEEFAAVHIREAAAGLDRVTGRSVVESVLDEIFSRFCIGK